MSCSSARALSTRTLREALERRAEQGCLSRAGTPESKRTLDDQKGGPEGTRDAQSAFRPLRDNGGLSPFVPRPRPLQRDSHTQRSEIPALRDELLPNTKYHLELLQLYGRLPVAKEEEGASFLPLPAAPHSSTTVSDDSPQAVCGVRPSVKRRQMQHQGRKRPQEWLPHISGL
ncbi:putative POM121-like protein 1 [Plecturocebus cupreus]